MRFGVFAIKQLKHYKKYGIIYNIYLIRSSRMNIEITRINEGISGNASEYIKSVNTDYLCRLQSIVKNIAENREERPVILISGPSGSGKTTTAFMIEKLLDKLDCTTHTFSMDNYFLSLTEEEKILAAEGKMDLESPKRVDSSLLSSHIEALGRCEEIVLPKYNFKKSAREADGTPFRRGRNELVIFEGIHALNPDVIQVPDSRICKIYVSVRTRVSCENVILHPSRIRLLRRMIRDSKFRHRSLRETMNMFASVEEGENKYIMPYKHRSDYDVDTFMAYELCAYKTILGDSLRELSDVPELEETIRLLDEAELLDSSLIPPDSLICEFIGSGEFKY